MRRVARRAGAIRLGKDSYEILKKTLYSEAEEIIRYAMIYCNIANRTTIT